MKRIIFTVGVLMSGAAYSQVGIDTETPKATLDVTGKPLDLTKVDGLIAPRLKGSELKAKDALYTDEQKASLVYVTEALVASGTSSKTVNVTSVGYFYFDGSVWQKLNVGNSGGSGTTNAWDLLGNTGTTAGTNFIGTTDAQDFVVKTNNTERERTYKEALANNTIKAITGGDLTVNNVSVGRGKGNIADNTVVGYLGLQANTTGASNVAVGSTALYTNTTGSANTALGTVALTLNQTGTGNVALGDHTLAFNTTGDRNIAIGQTALSNAIDQNKTGSENIGIGYSAGSGLQDGASKNIIIGSNQNLSDNAGNNQLNIGGAIFGTGLSGNEATPKGNIGIGTATPGARLEINNGTTNGAIKIVDGTQGTGKVLTSDANGLATWQTPSSSPSGNNNWSLIGNAGTTAGANFIGTTDTQDFVVKTNSVERERTLKTVNSDNTIKTINGGDLLLNGLTVGRGKGNKVNTVLGINALNNNVDGEYNTSIGFLSSYNNTSGGSNVGVGAFTLLENTDGTDNTALGIYALHNNQGDDNVALGTNALAQSLTGNRNIGIGSGVGASGINNQRFLESGDDNIVIGTNQYLYSNTGSNQLNIGGAIFGSGLTGNADDPKGNIGIGTATPGARLEVNNGTTNGAVKIVDGTQGTGKVLTSDANGLATWQDARTKAILGTRAAVGYDVPFTTFTDFRYTGASITLPPGKWLVTSTQFASIAGSPTASNWMFVRTTFSDENLTTLGQTGTMSADVQQPSLMSFTVTGGPTGFTNTGSIIINNTSGSNKTYKYIVGNTESDSTAPNTVFLKAFSGDWQENSITAIAIE